MRKLLIICILLLSIAITTSNAISCGAGRVGCVSSCIAQNCATGYCDNDVCRCSRCGIGPSTIFRRYH